MINETPPSADDRPALRAPQTALPVTQREQVDDFRQLVSAVLFIEHEPEEDPDRVMQRDGILMFTPQTRLTATFEGRLLIDSEEAYRRLDEAFAPLDHTPYFRERDGRHVVHAVSGRVHPRQRRVWVNALLFVLTFISVLIVGTEMAISEIAANNRPLANQLAQNVFGELWRGLPYALSIMLILGAHELGHYFAARYHRIAVTLPYFLPTFPFSLLLPIGSFIGTFGAFIQIQAPFRNRKAMLDIGAAGPLVGLVFTIPILIIGLATSPVLPIPPIATLEGNSLFYALAKTLVFGRFLPDGGVDVYINQLAFAGWAGLLMTSLNLFPVGQLDGGHVLYSLVGQQARRAYFPVMGLMVALLLVTQNPVWIVWLGLLLVFGQLYAPPLDMITRLDRRRQFIAILTLVVFIVTLVPAPLSVVENPGVPLPRENVGLMVVGAVIALSYLRLRRR